MIVSVSPILTTINDARHTPLPLHLAHQRQQIIFCVAEKCHPQIVIRHSRDQVRLILKTDSLLLQSTVGSLDIGYREIQDRAGVIEFRLLRMVKHQPHTVAVQKCQPRWRFKEKLQSQDLFIEIGRTLNIMGNNKKKSKESSNGNRPRNGNARVGTAASAVRRREARPASVGADASSALERSSMKAAQASSDVRTYSIPDYRLERPTFTVTQRTEKDKQGQEHVRYEVTGDLDAPVPPIRDSKYLSKEQAIEIYRYMGIAVALDWGLIVPVLKNAGDLNFLGLQRGITDLGERARNKKLKPEDVEGSTFTITNPGQFGAVFGLPIINQPNSAIMGVGGITKQPMVITDKDGNDSIAIRSVVHLTLGYDHRLIDGAVADQFMAQVKKNLETWMEEVG